MLPEIMPVIEGDSPRRTELAGVMEGKPFGKHDARAHTLGPVTNKEARSMPRGVGAVAERNRLRHLHTSAHNELLLIDSEVARAQKDLARLQRTKQRIPDKEERIATCKAIINNAPNRRAAAKQKVLSSNLDMEKDDRSIHLWL